jgi:hypothetical protein
MSEIPDDVMKAARNLYMSLENMKLERAKTLEAAKIQAFNNGDKIDMIARAILAERERCARIADEAAADAQGDEVSGGYAIAIEVTASVIAAFIRKGAAT